jgi:hypothetical protein
MVVQTNSPKGIFAVGIFLFFGAIMASLAGTTLVWRGTMLDRIWAFNLPAYRQLAPFGKMVGIPFLLLGATLACWRGLVQAPYVGLAIGRGDHRNSGVRRLGECLRGRLLGVASAS